jgi:hypothetical protein
LALAVPGEKLHLALKYKMDVQSDLHQALKGLFDRHKKVTVFPGEIVSVDEGENTCVVNDGDIEIYDVRLKALIDTYDQNIVLIPAVGSSVLVCNIGHSENAFAVILASEVEKVVGKIGTTEFLVDSSGYMIKKGSENLKTILNDLITDLISADLATPAGPGTMGPTIIANLTTVQTRLNTVLQ